jgi:hypothetical protein
MGPTKTATATPAESAAPKSEIVQLVEALIQRSPGPLDTMGMSAERQARLLGKTVPRRYRSVAVVGEAGSHAVVRVCDEPGMTNGKIVWIEKYAYPPGTLKHVAAGGLVPDGLQIPFDRAAEATIAMADETHHLSSNMFTLQYLQWKLETFQRTDQRAWVGKELKPHHCDPEGRGLSTSWEDPASAAA